MNSGVTWVLGVVTLLAAGLAIAAGSNDAISVPLGAIAVGVAALLLFGVLERTRWSAARPDPASRADPGHVRAALREGAFGRTELIALLDRLDRTAGSRLANTTAQEVDRIQALPPDEFREYLAARVGELERRT